VIIGADWVLPVDGPPVEAGTVTVEDGLIAAIGQDEPADLSFPGGVILPGLVNAHTHLEYTAMSGFGDGLPFVPWIEDHIVRKAAMSDADLLEQSRAGVAACLAGGVTTVADCCYAGTVAQAAVEGGIRAIVYVEGFSSWEGLEQRTRDRLDGLAEGPLLTPGVSPHAPFTVTLEDYAMMIGLARERGLPSATHLLESDRETLRLDAFAGVLGPDTVAIHLVRAGAGDIALLAGLDVPAVHCPRSNALLGCGTAPVPEMLAAGVRVGLGTDSPSSALDLDMWAEMRAAVMLARARLTRADALSAGEVLRMATLGGAEAVGLAAQVGSITPGKRADLTVLDLSGSSFLPWDDPVSAAVYAGAPERVALTVVDGRIRYERGRRTGAGAALAACRSKMIDAVSEPRAV
jgi:5-methylthioadenosine/S-adenosylhomocysteine deaminase